MYTLEQIYQAHSKVKSGADFPNYIKELKLLGVVAYTTYVVNGKTSYSSNNGITLSTVNKYENLIIAEHADTSKFLKSLKAHQDGATSYLSFCSDCAHAGIEKWVVNLESMSCTYYDLRNNIIKQELIPS